MQELINQYKQISDEIEKEKESEIDRLIAVLLEQPNEPNGISQLEKSSTDNPTQHYENMLALLCQRIKIIGELIQKGNNTHYNQLEEDLEAAIENTRNIESAWKITDEIIDHARDILTAICQENMEVLLPYFNNRYQNRLRGVNEVTPELFFLLIATSDAYERLGKRELSVSVLEYLCQVSKERNGIGLHQELISRVFGLISDRAPEATVRIARVNFKYFDQAINNYAGDFFWFYACALRQLGKNSEAVIFFEKCYKIRNEIYGENDWYTAIARREYSILSYAASQGKHEKTFLYRFIDNIEKNVYQGIDENSLRIIEGKTLYIILMGQSDIVDLELYDTYLCIYEKICAVFNDTDEPLLKIRLAKNLRGGYYLKSGDYIQAEEAFLDAINSNIADNIPEIVTVSQIKSNLLMIYYVQNDIEMALPLLSELLDALELDEKESGLSEQDMYRIYTLLVSIEIQSMIELDEEDVEDIKSFLKESCNNVVQLSSELPECTRELAVFIISAILLVLQNESANKEEQCLYLEALDKINREYLAFPIDQVQRTLLNYIAALLAWNLNDSKIERFFSNALQISEKTILPLSTKVAIFQSFAIYSAKNGKYNTAILYVAQALNNMENIWKSYVKYLNDERLMQVLTPTQLQFMGCYSMLRELADIASSYERILQFKALASLAGRERNRILHTTHVDTALLSQIRIMQDKIAALETESVFHDISDEYENEKLELRRLESHFAKTFPSDDGFTTITWEKVQKAIPDNAVVIEYFYCGLSYGQLQFDEDSEKSEMGFDVYVTQKRSGKCQLIRLTIPDGEQILSCADEFVEILQAESSGSVSIEQLNKVDELRALLYKKLIAPVLPYLEEFENVYIAPDYDLVNLPFEILYDEEQESLDDTYTVIKVECARDFLYQNQGGDPSSGNLIIGNPQYEIREQELGEREIDDSERHRSFELDARSVTSLPFSQIEVQQISKRCASACYTGYAASKQLLLSSRNYKNIHIATHGFFDLSDDGKNGMYSSCLLFAGVCNWLEDGNVSRIYGNGVVTADEVSRLDFRTVELVVLSSCLSGMNNVSINKGFHGMVGAFSAAGAHYVISHLWEANDFSTAILMDAFYYQYVEKMQSPPIALSLAKNYLKQVTIGELKRRHWFDYVRQSDIDYKTGQMLFQYENMDDQIRPFKGEAYWGGFACYQCY